MSVMEHANLRSQTDANITAVMNSFYELVGAPEHSFARQDNQAIPVEHGVYLIRCPKGKVLHVGRTDRGAGGLRRRIKAHIDNGSSFTRLYFKKDSTGSWDRYELLEDSYTFQFVVIHDKIKQRRAYRRRALLESFAAAVLKPKHCGVTSLAASKLGA